MEEKRLSNKSLVAVSLLLLSVVAGVILLFVMRPAVERDGIVLPDPVVENTQELPQSTQLQADFLTIDPNNVVDVLASLEAPEFFHQTYQVQINSGRTSSVRTVEIWVNGSWIHAEIHDGRRVKSVFTDGSEAWVWYDHDLTPDLFVLHDDLLLEDLLGLPNFDFQTMIAQAERTEAGYAVDPDTLLQYIYVHTGSDPDHETEYRFSLDTGLLFSNVVSENERQVYEVLQTAFDRLAYGDQAFEGRFCLPSGVVPFAIEARMPQP